MKGLPLKKIAGIISIVLAFLYFVQLCVGIVNNVSSITRYTYSFGGLLEMGFSLLIQIVLAVFFLVNGLYMLQKEK